MINFEPKVITKLKKETSMDIVQNSFTSQATWGGGEMVLSLWRNDNWGYEKFSQFLEFEMVGEDRIWLCPISVRVMIRATVRSKY